MKIFSFLFFVYLTFFLPISSALPQNSSPSIHSQAIHWQQTGLEYYQWIPSDLGTTLYLLKIDPQYFVLRPILAKDLGQPTLSAKTLAEKSQAIAMINANFFDPEEKPLGLIVAEGKILNPFHPTKWWAVFLQGEANGKIYHRIEKIFSKKQLRQKETGIQAGPRLVAQGKTFSLKENISRKSVVGIDTQGKIYLIAVEGLVSVSKLAQFLTKTKSDGGLELKDALNLDGGSSTQFYLKMNQGEVWSPGWTAIPVGLGVFPK